MTKNSSQKPVTHETQVGKSDNITAFNKSNFDDSIYNKGYDVYIEKAIRCACVLKANGEAQPNCRNCGGTKYIFVDKKLTKAVTQNMNKQTKYLNWSETDRGTINVTLRDVDKVAFMDRITNLNLVSTYSQPIQILKTPNNKLIGYTIYPIIAVTECYLFDTSDKPLKQLVLNTDFTIEDNKIVLDKTKYGSRNPEEEELTVSIRYTHFPQYHVLDINRDAVAGKGSDHSCTDRDVNTEYAGLPISCVARKAHFVMDDPNYDGESLYDNTYTNNNTLTALSDAIPFSLDYWVIRASAQDIVSALLKENNTAKMNSIKSSLP